MMMCTSSHAVPASNVQTIFEHRLTECSGVAMGGKGTDVVDRDGDFHARLKLREERIGQPKRVIQNA